MAGTIVVDRIESDSSYASTINVAGQITFSNTVNFGVFGGTAPVSGFYLPTTNNLVFTTASTERLRIDNSGNINIATAGARITGDFSTTTYVNRVMFQTSTTNGFTSISVIPNGTGINSNFYAYNNSDPTNTSYMRMAGGANAGTESRLDSGIHGTGTYLPMTFYTGGSERMRIDTSGNLQFNSGYGSVATAYGCRAWVNFNGTGTIAIRASGNVSSITDGGVGIYRVNFSSAMPDSSFSTVASSAGGGTVNGSTTAMLVNATSASAQTANTSYVDVWCYHPGNQVAQDDAYVCVSVFR